jgi:hypothetical protein
VLAAPTGSGKTGVMELAVLRLLSRHVAPDGSFRPPGGATKVVYLAPMRALVQERVKSWQDRWGVRSAAAGLPARWMVIGISVPHQASSGVTSIILGLLAGACRRC